MEGRVVVTAHPVLFWHSQPWELQLLAPPRAGGTGTAQLGWSPQTLSPS